jgi:hypothetical protein
MFTTIADFTADRFAPTAWEAAKKKARFAKTLIRFVEAGFPRRVCVRRIAFLTAVV